MKFCNVCDNMLYFKINMEEEDKGKTTLLYYCRKCGEIENIDELELIKDITYEKKTNINININKNIKHDPTIPHIRNMNCPNTDCNTNKNKEDVDFKDKDIIYYRYNEEDMKYMYMCVVCDTLWKP